MRAPLIVRDPYQTARGVRSQAIVSWVDMAPTILDFAGVFDRQTRKASPEVVRAARQSARGRQGLTKDYAAPGTFHGRSFLATLGEKLPTGWDEAYGSHTFHEITMYYPMRVVRERRFKLIWNLAAPLPFPFASDLLAASTWQQQLQLGPQADYGNRTVDAYVHRPPFELYDLENDPFEARNLADMQEHASTLKRLQTKLRDFQRSTNDPWISKWSYE
ncbi:MAG: heparan N-sulfatase, partial [Planctomycetales bacterium]|nr:heparan N-sulfatase [Planctomycetales bacterium]